MIRTIYQQDTPFNDIDQRSHTDLEITVTDPRHPLFNRRFPILWKSHANFSQGHVYVIYCEGITLRIPLEATNLCSSPFSSSPSKLTESSIKELITVAQEISHYANLFFKDMDNLNP